VQDEESPGQFCSPEHPIADCNSRVLPTIAYPFTEGSNPTKARSFGQLKFSIIERTFKAVAFSSPESDKTFKAVGSSSPESDASFSDVDSSSPCSEDPTVSPSISDGVPASLAEKVLVREWDRRTERGLFRYNVRDCISKV
jgi:hypothetical protein